jgi:Putative DNA-binding domain
VAHPPIADGEHSAYSQRMIPKRVNDIAEADFEGLLANGVPEGKTIDYKNSLPTNSDGDKKEFLADVSSFANTAGGDILFGVDETQGVPTGLPGLALADADLEIRRLDSIIGDGLEPRIRHAILVVQRSGKLPFLIVRIERSWIGPHRVIFKGHDKFYARSSAGKYPMDVSELRAAFTLATSVTERVRRFRAERIARLQTNDTPVLFVQAKSKTILHCIPLESFAAPVQYPVLRYSDQAARIPPMITTSGWSRRINLDGLVTYSGFPEGSISYTQLFRNGTIEAVEGHWLNVEHEGKRTIPYAAVEEGVLKYLEKAFEIQKELGVNPPIVVALTLSGTKGLEMARDVFSFAQGYPITDDDLVLPESVVDSFEEKPGKILKPLFDLIWNACGYARTRTLDDEGNWIYRA